MLPYAERVKHRWGTLRRTPRRLAKLGAKLRLFARFCGGLTSWAGFAVPVRRIAFPCKPVHPSTDHSTLNEVKVVWRDRPGCDAH